MDYKSYNQTYGNKSFLLGVLRTLMLIKPPNMQSFGHKLFISSLPVHLTGRGVLYPRVRDFYIAPTMSSSHWLTVVSAIFTNFGALYLTEILTDFGQILDSKSYDQA